MRMRLVSATLLLGLMGSTSAWAQAEPSVSKKELVAKILKLQQPVIEGLAQGLAEQPAAQLMQQAGLALQTRIAPERREEVGKGIQADVKKYLDETAPALKDKAIKLAPSTVGLLLEEKFNEEELKQLIAILESPINRRLQELSGEMQRVLSDKLIAEGRADVEPKVRVLQQNMAKRLGDAAPAPAASASKPPAKPSK
jgi:uncharacterized protein